MFGAREGQGRHHFDITGFTGLEAFLWVLPNRLRLRIIALKLLRHWGALGTRWLIGALLGYRTHALLPGEFSFYIPGEGLFMITSTAGAATRVE